MSEQPSGNEPVEEVSVPDICDLVLDDHELFRRRFAELDERRASGAGESVLIGVWESLAGELERHAAAEEELFYPRLLHRGSNAEEETEDAIDDHNKIRDAIAEAKGADPGTDLWWSAVLSAREENSKHIAEEERGALPDFRANVDPRHRQELGARWLEFATRHAGGRGIEVSNEDPDAYIERNS